MPGLTEVQELRQTTPFGDPSDAYVLGTLEGRKVAFLSRHGRGHRISPTELNFRANIYGFKLLGVERILSASAVGSLREEYRPLDILVPDQFFDRTKGRISTFFGHGLVAHIAFSHPVCSDLSTIVADCAASVGARVHRGGTYVNMEGPQFSTLAESKLYRSWGMDVIGMTNLQEAKLAREAEICYATVAMVTDFDCWHDDHEHVTVDAVIKVMLQNGSNARKLIMAVAPKLGPQRQPSTCPDRPETVLDFALITAPEKRDPRLMAKLDAVAGRVLKR